METALYLLFCLPKKFGGYALDRPLLNAKRAVNKRAESVTLARYLVPDLYWPGRGLDVEYDSEAFHSNPESLKNGARRTLALRTMHVEVISVTSEILYDARAFEALARSIFKKLGKRIYRLDDRFHERQRALRNTVLYR